MSDQDPSPEPDEASLRQLLEEAERRNEEKIKKVGGRVGLVITIPVILLFLWAGIFLIQYNLENPETSAPAADAPAATPAPLTPEQADMAQYDMFRDEKDKVVKTNILGLEKTSDKLIDKEDIRFGMELLNFMHRPADPPPEKKR